MKQGFAQLVRDLSGAFKPNGWLLSTTVLSGASSAVDAGYEVPQLNRYLDWISLMVYDYRGTDDVATGYAAPIPSTDGSHVKSTVQYWIENGASPEKLILGISSAGHLYTLENPQNHDLKSRKSAATAITDRISSTPGSLAFYEICNNTKNNGWKIERDSGHRIDLYAYRDNRWVSFDDVTNVRAKAKYIRDMNLGGGMIWTLDFDDFTGSCECGKYPLLSTLSQETRSVGVAPTKKCI